MLLVLIPIAAAPAGPNMVNAQTILTTCFLTAKNLAVFALILNAQTNIRIVLHGLVLAIAPTQTSQVSCTNLAKRVAVTVVVPVPTPHHLVTLSIGETQVLSTVFKTKLHADHAGLSPLPLLLNLPIRLRQESFSNSQSNNL